MVISVLLKFIFGIAASACSHLHHTKKPMYKIHFLLLFALLALAMGTRSHTARAVPSEIFELEFTDTARMINTVDSARLAFIRNDVEQSIALSLKALELSEISANRPLMIESALILARSYHKKTAPYLTLKYYMMAINEMETAGDTTLLPAVYQEIGNIYHNWKLPQKKLEYYAKAYALLQTDKARVQEKIDLLLNIAVTQQDIGHTEDAISAYRKLLNLYTLAYNRAAVTATHQMLADLYRSVSNYEKAIYHNKEALIFFRQANDHRGILHTLNEIAEASYQSKNHAQAVEYFDAYIAAVRAQYATIKGSPENARFVNAMMLKGDILESHSDMGYLQDYDESIRCYNAAFAQVDMRSMPLLAARTLNKLGGVYMKTDNLKAGISYTQSAIVHGRQAGDALELSKSYWLLSQMYAAKEDFEEALQYHQQYVQEKEKYMAANTLVAEQLASRHEQSTTRQLSLEQIEDIIKEEEMREYAVKRLRLQAERNQKALQLARQHNELNTAHLQNQILENEKVEREKDFLAQQFERDMGLKIIENLQYEKQIQEMRLNENAIDQENKRQKIALLKNENALAQSKQAYYILFIVLISIVLISAIVGYLHYRRVSLKLRLQNQKIEKQSVQLRQAYQNLELLSKMGRDITSSLIVEQIVEIAFVNIQKLMQADVFGIGVYEEKSLTLHFPFVRENDERIRNVSVPTDEPNTLAGYCVQHQEEVIIGDYVSEHGKYITCAEAPVYGDGNAASIIYLPLMVDNTTIGVLTVQSFQQRAFNDYHLNILRNIAIYATIALENAHTFRQIAEKSQNLRAANQNIRKQNAIIEKQNDELISINKEKNHLIGILAHDLRNPLSMAMSMTELVQYQRQRLSAEQDQALEIIWKALQRMNEMIMKILDVKAIESKKLNIEVEVLDIPDIFDRLHKHFQQEAERKNIRLIFDEPDSCPLVVADTHYTVQVMENLISNALKFSPSGTEIRIVLASDEQHVYIKVIDQGPGISASDMKKLFGKYQRLTARPTAGEHSTGLGLSIVKKYMEAMQGDVWCESVAGQGATFVVRFHKGKVDSWVGRLVDW